MKFRFKACPELVEWVQRSRCKNPDILSETLKLER
jgi:hypothetical protein